MDKIIEKYYISPGSVLVNYNIGTNGVDCWFDSPQWREHRCLSFEDFNLIKPNVMKNYLVQMTNGHFFIISSDLNYKVGDFMAVVHNVVSVVQVGIQIRDGLCHYDVTSSRVDVLD